MTATTAFLLASRDSCAEAVLVKKHKTARNKTALETFFIGVSQII
jgi:hypothetical protein